MSPEQFVWVSIVAAALTCVALLRCLGAVVRRSSRLVGLKVLGWTVGGTLALLVFARLFIGYLDGAA
ncbi:hypothetical protein GCM10009737_34090 [Nocardioides lentus]|uniref:Uncharacterized protein n=1 Tax=Nocardioides lentus TaxID=338077 RepID=A0ABP5B664_9ACTN